MGGKKEQTSDIPRPHPHSPPFAPPPNNLSDVARAV